MDQPRKVANPARGQLDRENVHAQSENGKNYGCIKRRVFLLSEICVVPFILLFLPRCRALDSSHGRSALEGKAFSSKWRDLFHRVKSSLRWHRSWPSTSQGQALSTLADSSIRHEQGQLTHKFRTNVFRRAET